MKEYLRKIIGSLDFYCHTQANDWNSSCGTPDGIQDPNSSRFTLSNNSTEGQESSVCTSEEQEKYLSAQGTKDGKTILIICDRI